MRFEDVGLVVLAASVFVLSVAYFALMRHVGLIHLRVNPLSGFKMTDEGPEVGSAVSASLGWMVADSGAAPSDGVLLIAFVSPGCGVCEGLVPHIVTHHSESGGILTVLADPSAHFAARFARLLGDAPFARGERLAESWNITSPPYGVAVSDDGTVLAKSPVATREDLDQLARQGREVRSGGATQIP